MSKAFLVLFFALVLAASAVVVRPPQYANIRTTNEIAQPFKFNVCDGAKGAIITALNVAPSPIVLGDNITLKGAVKVNVPFNANTITSIALTIKKSVFGAWVEIPCVDNLGSCTYETNLCDLLSKNQQQICAILKPLGLPCQCPFAAGTYAGPSSGISVATQNPGISWLTDGDFYGKVVFTGASGEYACTEVYASLASK